MEMTKEWFFAFNNKCAKFTGWDYNFSSLYHPPYEFAKAVGIGQGAWTLNTLRFHSDWNWIMEVVDKIESITHGEDDFEIEGIQLKYLIHQRLGKTSKKAVIQAIDQFIDWYNKQKES